ncbi:hypothetical protein WJX75_008525 [Coccomyxa subellipsoidea]|uniref:SGNH hydrolase-type esterase domain-containing protein n=1 Tax=Coccomyxa subellipsoidea TaxID=248742 RepID=A0ABR2YM72_9CHLO
MFLCGYVALWGLGWGGALPQSWKRPTGVELKQGVCSYGDLPGYWNPVANRTVGNWTLLDLECQLEDRLGHHLRAAKNSQTLSSADVGILILGDSADRNLIFDMCIEAGQQVQPFNVNLTSVGPKTCNRGEEWGTYKDVVNCNTCRIPGLRVTKESIWGFYEGEPPEKRLGLPLERTQAGLELFKEEHGRYPDLVVLHSNYWDVAQIVMFREWDAPEWNYVNTLQTWLANADKVASFLKEKAEETGMMLAYRTVQYPQMEDVTASGAAKDHQIGQRFHVTYLNAAGRQLARKHDLFLVDIELMFQKFWSPLEFLSDNHHLNREANYQVLNVYLNLLRNKGRHMLKQQTTSRALRLS